ncbi:DHHA1 domain-containing protein [Lachnospiraceae bacterium ZAX-1]
MNPIELITLLQKQTVYIQTHNFPDPDAIASAFGLQQFLLAHGIPSSLCYAGKIDRLSSKKMLDTFCITMLSKSEISHMTKHDYIVLVDSQKLNANVTDLTGDEVACIDHHPTYFPIAYRYMDIQLVGSCSSIIASYYKQTSTPPSALASAALAYGIKMDTADFSRMTTKLDIEMFAYLFEYADWSLVKKMYRNTLEFNDLKAYGAAIQNIKIFERTGFAYIPFNCSPALIAIISEFILSLNVIDVAIVYAFQKDGIRFSLRSDRRHINVGNLISQALYDIGGGGGHHAMAGGMIPKENVPLLGNDIPTTIQELFLDAYDYMID